jgi:hypothetical protein
MRWRRRVEAELAGSGLAFKHWLVLDATHQLIREPGDAVSQNQVAVYLQLNRVTVGNAFMALERMGLVSRGGPMSGPAWRVILCREGLQLLRQHARAIEALSVEF